MTREEQIEEFIKLHAYKFSVRNGYEAIEELMREMAQWCDNNPKSPWIRSDERWPNNEGRIFMYDSKSGDINDAYSIGKGLYWDEDGLNPIEINDCHFMEYWMPTPKI